MGHSRLMPNAGSCGEDFDWNISLRVGGSHDGVMVGFRPSGQDQFNQCGQTQAHPCQKQPGLMLQVLYSRSQGEAVCCLFL